MFNSPLADVVSQIAHFPFGGTRDSILMNIDYWAGKNGMAMIFLTNL